MSASGLVKFCVVVLLAVGVRYSFVRIGPDEVGIKSNNVGTRGIVQEDFGPGLHLGLPFFHTWTVLPARIRKVEMTKNPLQRSALGKEALIVQSSDGDRVMLDLNIMFRIHPGDAHRLLQDSGAGDGHVNVILNLASDRLRAIFGTLKTEEFYDSDKRHAKSREALLALQKALAPRFIDVVDVLILDFEFEPKYEEKIREKKLADQRSELAKSEATANQEKAHVTEIGIETDKQKKVIAANAKKDADAKKAEAGADLYRSEQQAKGTLAKAHADAQVKAAKTEAMGAGGGSNYIALEAANNLNIGQIVLPTTPSQVWFDVAEMAKKLGAKQ
jgi:regulator of protease activity HflC (stomatin/prohibitin superfamily)